MFLTTLYFIPCIVSLSWVFSFLFKEKNQRQWLFMAMLVVDVFYFAATAVYILPQTDYNVLVKMDAICVPVVFALLAMQSLYIYMLQPRKTLKASHLILLFPSAIFGSLVGLMYYLLGFENTARLVRLRDETGVLTGEFDTQLYKAYVYLDDNLVAISIMIFLLMFCLYSFYVLDREGYKKGDLLRFVFKKASLKPSIPKSTLLIFSNFCLIPYGILGRKFMADHVLLTSVMMLAIALTRHLLCHMEYNTTNKAVTLHDMTHVLAVNDQVEEPKPSEVSTKEEREDVVEKMHVSRTSILENKFSSEMEAGAFKDEDLTLQSMAERLGVSARTLSTLVNNSYGIPFRDVVNKYRIEHAKKYLSEHPDATQSTVAFECGFKNDSVFNKKFKELEGVTPLMWVTHHAMSESQN